MLKYLYTQLAIRETAEMTLNEQVASYRDNEILNTYKANPENIIQALNLENDSRDDYEGREILELLQNAVDQVNHGGKIYIGLKDKVLTVANTGEPFNLDGVKSVMLSHLSLNKRKNNNTIGQKGLGFRSILNWSDNISIFSEGLSIKFSEEFRKKYFAKEGILDDTSLLAAPEILNEDKFDKGEFDTVIKIIINDEDKLIEVKRQLYSVDKYTLLFLDKISNLTVSIDENETRFTREKEDEAVIIYENEEGYTFDVFTKNGEINGKKYEIVIAYDDEIDPKSNVLYSYFATKIDFPIKWKCHATFDLKLDRNSIKASKENQILLQELAIFICDKASELSKNNYKMFDSLLRVSQFPKSLNIKDFDFNAEFDKYFYKADVLPTFRSTSVSLESQPYFYDRAPFFFNSIMTHDILLDSSDERRNGLLVQKTRKFIDKDLAIIINSVSEEWDVSQSAKVFCWWVSQYPKVEVLPHLLKDKAGEWIEREDSVFLNGNVISEFPGKNWVKLKIISPQYQDALISELNNNYEFNNIDGAGTTRKLYNWMNRVAHLSFIEQTSESIISPINSSIDGDFEHSKEFMIWLYESSINPDNTIDVSNLNVELFLPTINGTVERASKIFIGNSYNNHLGATLFKDTNYFELIPADKIEVSNEELYSFIDFLKEVNVHEFPKIEWKKVQNNTFEKMFVEPLITTLLKKRGERRAWKITTLEFEQINGFSELISKITTKDVLEWLNVDPELMGQVTNTQNFGIVKYRVGQKRTDDELRENTPSFIKFLLNTTPWISINNKKYAPEQIVFYEKLGQNVEGICGVKKDDLIDLGFTDELIRNLNFRTDISELPTDEIYNILQYLNLRTDPNGTISKHLYSKVLDATKEKSIVPNFVPTGIEIFCMDGKFYLNTEVKYAINRPPSVDRATHFMNVAYRNNSKNIQRWFGVEPYEFNSSYKHHLESEIQLEWVEKEHQVITTISALTKLTDMNIQRIRPTKIVLCTEVENEESGFLKDFDYAVGGRTNYYLKVPDGERLFELLSNEEFIESIIDIYVSMTNVNIDKDKIELYLSKPISEQKNRMMKDYDVNWDEYNDKLWNTDSLNIKISKWFAKGIAEFDGSYEQKELSRINFYNQTLSKEDVSLLITLLSESGGDISSLNALDELLDVNVVSYWQREFKDYLMKKKDDFVQICYVEALHDDGMKEKFLDKISEFKNFNESTIDFENSIRIDVEEVAKDYFPELKTKIETQYSIDEIYDENVNSIINDEGISTLEFDDFIQAHKKLKSLLYFEIPSNLHPELIKYFDGLSSKNSTQQEIEATSPTQTTTVNTRLEGINEKDDRYVGEGRRENSQASYGRQNLASDRAGESAEEIAYAELSKNMKIIWHTKYSKKPADRNNLPPDGIVCDMWVEDLLNGNMYFEVKSSKSEFEMTINEYNSMRNNPESYEVILVDKDTKKISRHKLSELEGLKSISKYLFRFKQITTE